MNFVRGSLVVIVLQVCTICGANAQKHADIEFVVAETFGAPGVIDQVKIGNCLHLLLQELRIENRELPRIMIFHVSRQNAEYLGLGPSSVWQTRGSSKDAPLRYEIRVVGEPSNFAYSYMMERILQRHFALAIEEQQRAAIVERVKQSLGATVSAKAFRLP